MKQSLYITIFAICSFFGLSAFTKAEDPFTELLKKLEDFTKKYPQEKIHLHLDKPYYAIGDDIWFNSYVVNTKTNEPTNISNIIYVELINERDSIAKQLKLQMKGGIAWGDFKLTDSLSEGNYRIRAYTQWMRNTGPAFFFDKTIKIAKNSPNKIAVAKKSIASETDVQFFPEGGNLIESLPSKIAVKVVNKNGLGENISAVIIDNEGLEALNFNTTYLGMGSFILTPTPGKTYKAKIKFNSGIEKIFDLPKAEKSGYALNVNNTDSAKMVVKIMISNDLLNKGDLNLIAQRNGNLYSVTKIPTTKQLTTVILPKNNLPSGIVQLTLFNPENNPISERIAFINNSTDKIDLGLENLKQIYNKRENINLNLLAHNQTKPVQGSFSISVTNATIVAPDLENETNILTSLLLTSDLVGYVEKPNYYFMNNEVETRIQLDNLLLTQGWRKINWKEVSSSQDIATKYPAEKSLKISGTVTTNSNKPIAKGKISLLSSTKGMFVSTTETDENGRFIFDEMSFGDSLKFVVQASTKENKKNVKVKIDRFPNQETTTNKNTGDVEINVNTSLNKYLKESELFFEEQYKKGFLTRTNLLKTVTITQKRAKKEDSAAVWSSNYNGRGNANQIITANDLANSYSLAQYIAQGRVIGVGDSAGYPINARNGEGMAVSLDGMIVSGLSLEEIMVSDIESVEVLRSPSYLAAYGSAGMNGLLIISMKRGEGRKLSAINSPGLVIYQPKGYDIPRQFYSPKYGAVPDTNPDLRTTVYWNPQVVTDITGKGNFSFYNTDQSGNYRVIIEGIDADGNLARKVVTYEVK